MLIATFRQRRHENQDRLQWDWVLRDGSNDEPIARSTESYNNKGEAIHGFELTTGTKLSGEGLTASASGGIQNVRSIQVEWETPDADA